MSKILEARTPRLILLALGIILVAMLGQSNVYAANVNVEVGTGGQRAFGATPGGAWDGSGNAGTFELVNISVGDTVTFTPWNDFHSVTGCDPNSFWVNCGEPGVAPIGGSGFQSAPFTHGPITFSTAGEFPWLCNVHPGQMRGKVVVTGGNTPPVANNDSPNVAQGGSVAVDVRSNDTDAEDGIPGGALAIVASPSSGTAVINNAGTPADPSDDFIDYTHDGSAALTDSFTYTVDDSGGLTSNIATVNVSVTANAPPTVDCSLLAVEDHGDDDAEFFVQATATDPEDGALTPTIDLVGVAEDASEQVVGSLLVGDKIRLRVDKEDVKLKEDPLFDLRAEANSFRIDCSVTDSGGLSDADTVTVDLSTTEGIHEAEPDVSEQNIVVD